MKLPDLNRALQRHQLLLASDAALPSVAALVAGEPVKGSWWGHRRGRAIFAAIRALEDHPDAVVVPLVGGKVTFVHRDLWPALLAVAVAGERWQTVGLSAAARRLITKLRTADVVEAAGDPVRQISRRLLARAYEVHTERGSHAQVLESWDRWADRAGVKPLGDAARAKAELEQAVGRLSGATKKRLVPWPANPEPRARGSRS